MKKILLLVSILLLAACNKNTESANQTNVDSTKIIDSINAVRAKYNDSIKALNSQNRFPDMSGEHKLTYSSQGSDQMSGIATFTKSGRDEYEVKGSAEKGSNFIRINGNAKRVSQKHFTFTGEIQQSIKMNNNGKIYTRKGKQTFASKGNYFRLQDMVNDAGFVDYIDIH